MLKTCYIEGDIEAGCEEAGRGPLAGGEFAAAVACAIAEDLGTDVTGIRIKSIKRV